MSSSKIVRKRSSQNRRPSLLPYLQFVRRSLNSTLCIGNSPLQAVERHNKSEVKRHRCQLRPDKYVSLELLKREQITTDCYIFTFATPDRTKPLYVSSISAVSARFFDNGKEIERPYGPISTNAMIGKFQLLVKIYPNGTMTKHLVGLRVGEKLDFKYHAHLLKIQFPFKKRFIGMIAGGIGISPMIQALHTLLGNDKDDTEICLLFANRTSDNIPARKLLDKWANEHERFSLTHVISKEPDDSEWDGKRGRINKELIEKSFAKPSSDIMIFICGPLPIYGSICGSKMNKTKITGVLGNLGYSKSNVYKF